MKSRETCCKGERRRRQGWEVAGGVSPLPDGACSAPPPLRL